VLTRVTGIAADGCFGIGGLRFKNRHDANGGILSRLSGDNVNRLVVQEVQEIDANYGWTGPR
jgi:hypothetical protein